MASASAAACSHADDGWATTATEGRLLCARASSVRAADRCSAFPS